MINNENQSLPLSPNSGAFLAYTVLRRGFNLDHGDLVIAFQNIGDLVAMYDQRPDLISDTNKQLVDDAMTVACGGI